MSLTTFRKWMRCLSVPMIHLGPTRYVEMNSFLIALRAISRIGQPDFFVPGCKTGKQNKRPRNPETETRNLNPAYVQSNLPAIIAELMYARKTASLKVTTEIRSAAEKAARRMVEAGFQFLPLRAQEAYDKRAIRATAAEGILDDPALFPEE